MTDSLITTRCLTCDKDNVFFSTQITSQPNTIVRKSCLSCKSVIQRITKIEPISQWRSW